MRLWFKILSTKTASRINTRVASVAPFEARFSSKAISRTRTGPRALTIDLVLQGKNVVWRIYGANYMVKAKRRCALSVFHL
ncbi:hypothetical protein FEM48_Zijuj07G0131900 [Ziziphus jujuba var. spinosa]|uniref:Xylanase inhibitor C-terminal domain-containing protein n=1 Tax=Ziziphus jujuba var. spinosa TaxID=714518 RepID=A0A978V4U4_ZIZJJ|nr:hypothetical protein FEM48_Zijuj07G0131900 [Ziziphus jujuba var. spinosa]